MKQKYRKTILKLIININKYIYYLNIFIFINYLNKFIYKYS